MPRRHRVELETNKERWMVSYADFITLLFAFFVVMYSISQVNESKYKVLSNTLSEVFGVRNNRINPIPLGETSRGNPQDVVALSENSRAHNEGLIDSDIGGESEGNLQEIGELIADGFADLIAQGDIELRGNQFSVEIELKSSLLFFSGEAELVPESVLIVSEIGAILAGYMNPIHVEGFTDNVPINNELFSSNWELSAARSSAVVHLLVDGGVQPDRLAAVGYGEYQPISDNNSEKGRDENRRVVLVVSRNRDIRSAVSGLEGYQTSQVVDEYSQLIPGDEDLITSSANAPLFAERIEETVEVAQNTLEDEQADANQTVVTQRRRNGGLLITNDPINEEAFPGLDVGIAVEASSSTNEKQNN